MLVFILWPNFTYNLVQNWIDKLGLLQLNWSVINHLLGIKIVLGTIRHLP